MTPGRRKYHDTNNT